MRLAVLKERAGETRVAATPETVGKLIQLGLSVAVERGAGAGASIPDAAFAKAGAEIAADAHAALNGANIIFAVQPPVSMDALPRGALLVCISGAQADRGRVAAFAKAGVDVAAMELLPRITRAQSMDVLSSQANLAGYRAVIEGSSFFDRAFPMMMTAAGTVPPARVFVIGAGVAGLQAIATARRLGAIVSATDVRPAAKEEIKSLGATFVGVEDAETASQTGAYAKEMSADFRRKQAELMAATVAKNDLVICTALVQGGRAPVIVTQAMVDAMRPGSVVVDIAADGGGNCEATKPGEAYVTEGGVKIVGFRNWPGRISVAASTLYAKNLLTFLTSFWDKDAKAPRLPEDDAIVQGVMLTRGGRVVHANFASEAEAHGAAPASEASPSAAVAPQPPAEEAATAPLPAAEAEGVPEPGTETPAAPVIGYAAPPPEQEEAPPSPVTDEAPVTGYAVPPSADPAGAELGGAPKQPASETGPVDAEDAAAAVAAARTHDAAPGPSVEQMDHATEAASGDPAADETGLTPPGFPPETGGEAVDPPLDPPMHEAAVLPPAEPQSAQMPGGKKRQGGGGGGGGGRNRPNQPGPKNNPNRGGA